MKVCLRRKQQHRARRHIADGLDRRLGNVASLGFASRLHLDQEGDAEPCDIDGCAVISVAIKGTMGTDQPATPFHRISSMEQTRRAIRLCGFPTAGAGMRSATRLFRAEADAYQMALVAQDMPNLRTDRRVVAPIPPLPPHPTASPHRLECGKVLAADEGAPPDQSGEQEQIGSQMSQFAVARLIEPPAALDFLGEDGAFGIILGQVCNSSFELVNLATGACLMAVESSCIEKEGAGELHRVLWLTLVGAEHHSCDQAFDAPIEAQHAFDSLPVGKFRFFDLHNHLEHHDAMAITSDLFP